jgi:hypothetical protein
MAYHKKHHKHHHRRRNPLGLSGGLVKEAAFVAGGAVGAAALPGMIAPSFATGWMGVLASGVAAVGLGFVGRVVGGPAGGADMLKGGLAITVLKALNQAGIKTPGLGLYAPSWFGIPTASSQYLVAANGNQPGYNRGGGTILFPGPGGMVPVPAAKAAGVGYHRFRSRYAGGYGG